MKRYLLTLGLMILAFAAGALTFSRHTFQQASAPPPPTRSPETHQDKVPVAQDSGTARRSLADPLPLSEEQSTPKAPKMTQHAPSSDRGEVSPGPDQFIQKLLQDGTEKSEWQTGDLLALAVDDSFDMDERHSALTELLGRIQTDDTPRNEKLKTLLAIKDSFSGEDRQSIMKTLGMLQDVDGGDVIINSLLQLPNDATRVMDGMRMLSYVGPTTTLRSETVDAMIGRYQEEPSPELQRGLSITVATAGGDKGMTWFLEQVNASQDFMSWTDMVKTLGNSGSAVAYNYLHQLINTLARDENYETHKQLIRNAVMQLQATLQDKGLLPPQE